MSRTAYMKRLKTDFELPQIHHGIKPGPQQRKTSSSETQSPSPRSSPSSVNVIIKEEVEFEYEPPTDTDPSDAEKSEMEKEKRECVPDLPVKEEILSEDESFDPTAGEPVDEEEDVKPPLTLFLHSSHLHSTDENSEEVGPLSLNETSVRDDTVTTSNNAGENKTTSCDVHPVSKCEVESSSYEEDPFANFNSSGADESESTGSTSSGKRIQSSDAKECSNVPNGSNVKEQQVCAKFCFLFDNNVAETFTKLKKAFEDVVSETQVSLWFDYFKKGKL